MTQNISVQYFPPKQGARETDLGGGYVTSGILKTSFRVIKSDKNENGFFISLPSKQDANGEWKEIVSFVNKEANDVMVKMIKDKINGDDQRGTSSTPSPASGAPGNSARRMPPKTPGSGVPGAAPW